MITLNKLAKRCLRIAIRRKKLGRDSSPHAIVVAISCEWRGLCKASEYRSNNIPKYSEQEEAAADVIIEAITYLEKIGCRNIDQLLKDKVCFNSKRED